MLGLYLQRQHLHIFHGNRFAVKADGIGVLKGAIAGYDVAQLGAVGQLKGLAMAGKIKQKRPVFFESRIVNHIAERLSQFFG